MNVLDRVGGWVRYILLIPPPSHVEFKPKQIMAEKETEEPKEELYIQYGPDVTPPAAPVVMDGPTSIDYGNGMVARRLVSGRWALQEGEKFVDLRSKGGKYRWKWSDNWFKDCIGSLEEVEQASGWISPEREYDLVPDTNPVRK